MTICARPAASRLNIAFDRVRHQVQPLLLVALLGAVGCAPGKTLTVTVDGEPAAGINWLVVRAFDGFGAVAEQSVAVSALPVQVVLRPKRTASALRVVSVGRGAQPTRAGAYSAGPSLALTLSTTFADGDDDGVIDMLDDCPTVADWDQTNARGSGAGDACLGGAGSDGGNAASDLGHVVRPADAGPPDASTRPDLASGPDLGPVQSSCDPTKVIVCEGFEGDLSRWSTNQSSGTVAIDKTHVYTGSAALKLHTDALASGAGIASIVSGTGFPASDLFVRAWVYVPSGFDNPAVTLCSMAQTTSPYHAVNLQLEGGGLSTYNNLGSGVYHGVGGTVTPDRWTCVEYEVRFASSGAVNVWINDNAVAAISMPDNTAATPAPGEMQLGIAAQSSGTSARDLWLDDIVVNNARIGCH